MGRTACTEPQYLYKGAQTLPLLYVPRKRVTGTSLLVYTQHRILILYYRSHFKYLLNMESYD